MTALNTISKIYGPGVLKKYRNPLLGLLIAPLDAQGSAIREWLFRKKKIKIGSPFFQPLQDEELEELIRELQIIAQKKRENKSLMNEEKLLVSAFKRTVNKLLKMDMHLL